MAAATTTTIALLLLLLSPSTQGLNTSSCHPPDLGSTLKLYHANSPCFTLMSQSSLPWPDNVIQMQSHDTARLLFLAAGRNDIPIASGWSIFQSSTYIVQAKVGTPPQTLLLAVDTSNDAAWFPCLGCQGCPNVTFNPRTSSTYKRIHCDAPQCSQVPSPRRCGGRACWFTREIVNSIVEAKLVQDNITLGSTDFIRNFIFGCVQNTTGNSFPAQGLLGLGRGPLSLLSQTASIYHNTFSYCLPSYRSPKYTGSLTLGPNNQPQIAKTTPLLTNPRRPSLYYVNLMGIIVGRRVVNIPPNALAFNPNSGAGTILDSGTMFTSLVKPAYEAVRDAFRWWMLKDKAIIFRVGGFDTCYNVTIKYLPPITFMFSGMNVTITRENFIIYSTAGPTACLAMAAAAEGSVDYNLNVIASFQQQNLRVLINAYSVGVVPETCT